MLVLFQPWPMLVVAIMYFGFLLPLGYLASLFTLKNRRFFFYPAWRFYSQVVLRIGFLTRLTIHDRRTSKDLGLHVCNHQSVADIPIAACKIHTAPMMKREVLDIPFFGKTALHSGSIVVDRRSFASRQKAFNEAKQRLIDGLGVQTYPEGTRSKNGTPKTYEQIKPRLMYLCYELGIPVIPMSIFGSRRLLSKKGFIRPFQKVGLIYHDVLYPGDFPDKDEFAQACWRRVIDGYGELEKELGAKSIVNLQSPQTE